MFHQIGKSLKIEVFPIEVFINIMTNLFDKKIFEINDSGKSIAIFVKQNYLVVDKKLVRNLKNFSILRNKCDARICLHREKEDPLQNMIVLNWKKNCKKIAHKHLQKDETYHMIAGSMLVNIYSNRKKIKKKIKLLSKNKSILRVKNNTFHSIIPITDLVIFHESRKGPFSPKDNIFLK